MLIIGLDGASWKVLTPLIQKGELPTFQNLLMHGCHGYLESIVPPVTGGAWVSIATGKNPGKTGVIDFLNRRNSQPELISTSSVDYKGRAFWDYLDDSKEIAIFNYPMLFPPYNINGVMVSGVGSSASDCICYPPSFRDELEELAGKYQIYIDYHNERYKDPNLFFEDVMEYIEKFEKWVYHLSVDKKWDLIFLVFSITDWIQHRLWAYIDQAGNLDNPNDSPAVRFLIDVWKNIDRILGNLLEANIDRNVLLLSDHGFGSNEQTFNLASWLIRKGYMVKKEDPVTLTKSHLSSISSIISNSVVGRLMPEKIKRVIRRNLKSRVVKDVDFDNSQAYCLGHTIPFGAIYINEEITDDRERIRQEIIRDLRNIDQDIGIDLSTQIYKREDLYWGNKLERLPDIVFSLNEWKCSITEDFLDRPLFEEKPFSDRHTGTHRMRGIFFACGPDIIQGKEINGISLLDIAPTVLHMFDLPIPVEMDGRVIEEIFKKDSDPGSRSIRFQKESSTKEAISKRLSGVRDRIQGADRTIH